MKLFGKRKKTLTGDAFDKAWREVMEGWDGSGDAIWTSTTTGVYPGSSGTTKSVTWPKVVAEDPIETAADDVLIFELIKRGYAVAKMPADELAKVVGE